jgi:peptidoglycan/LPS O-acetylase OafA/YrhL
VVAVTPTQLATPPAAVERKDTPGFRPDVQALRAVAVLLVVLNHAHVPGLGGGYIGVDVFFVISGFLITGLLTREQERTGRISILKFYGRRMRRIMPAAALVLIATVVASYYWLGYIRGAHVAEDAEWSSVFLANFHFASVGTGYLHATDAPSTLRHFWSLAVEEQFYVVWPALFLLLGLLRKVVKSRFTMITAVGVIIVASYVFSIVYTGRDATDAYFSPLTRACELAAGAMLALLAPSMKKMPRNAGIVLSLAGMAGIIVTAFVFTENTVFPGAMVALPVLATCAVLAGGEAAAITAYNVKPIQLIGLWSYSLYLWHWPVLTIAEENLGHVPPAWIRMLLVAGSIALAAATYYLVENPIRNAALLRRRAVVSVALGIALIAAVVGVSVYEVGTHPAIPAHTAF